MSKTEEKGIWQKIDDAFFFLNTLQILKDGPKIPMYLIVNIHKGGMLVICLLGMLYFQNFSLPALLITLYHGSYGLIWIFKDIVFPDKSFELPLPLGGVVNSALFLLCYASMALTIVSSPDYTHISIDRFLVAGFIYIFGVVLMISADAQKNFTLLIKKGLIDNGIFARTRNPNYLGEISLYLAFGILAQSTWCYGLLLSVWSLMFMSRMKVKDLSLKRKEGWKEYSKKSYLLLPKLLSTGEF